MVVNSPAPRTREAQALKLACHPELVSGSNEINLKNNRMICEKASFLIGSCLPTHRLNTPHFVSASGEWIIKELGRRLYQRFRSRVLSHRRVSSCFTQRATPRGSSRLFSKEHCSTFLCQRSRSTSSSPIGTGIRCSLSASVTSRPSKWSRDKAAD